MQTLALILLLILALPMAALAQAPMSRGAYLAKLGDCTSCHTAVDGKPFAGGYSLHSPFGTIYGSNITPDPEYGIGNWSLRDFTRAVREGVAKDGTRLYPAMPYADFTKMSDDDVQALYDYFMHEVKPVHEKPPETHLPFPFNQRWALIFWNWVFFNDARYQPKPFHDASWNRGAYIVQALGHCGGCHTPRGPAYEERARSEDSPLFLSGGVLDHWYADKLTADPVSGLGGWHENDIANFLGSGEGNDTVVFGSMQEVVNHSGQYMTPADRMAIAHYLKSLKASGEEARHDYAQEKADFELPGAGLYANFCAKCHQANGTGQPPRVPALAGNATVLSDDPTSVIRIVLEGSRAPVTPGDPNPARMPGFGSRFTNQEVADVVNFIRHGWDNDSSRVFAREIDGLKEDIQKTKTSSVTHEKR